MYIILFSILGLFTGSFLNVCIDRLPRRESIVFPPSHCESCNHKLSVPDLVPVFSYLFLRGKCRYCRAHIPLRIPIVEAVTAVIFGLLTWKFGLSLELVFFLVYACLFVIIFVIDLENQLVLNVITYPSMILALAFAFFRPEIAGLDSLGSGTVFRAIAPVAGEATGQAVISLLGGLLGLVAMSLPYLIYSKGMGMGDIKLALLVGLMTGYPLIILALVISWILGGIVAGLLLGFKIRGRKDPIPAAVFMVTAGLITLLWGQDIWVWYFGSFTF